MKRLESFILTLILVFVYVGSVTQSFAYEKKEHNELMSYVLFRNFKNTDTLNPDDKEKIRVLGCACYLCIDQFQNNGGDELAFLQQFGIKGIPKNISEISFSASGRNHRSYTHRGWCFNYKSYGSDMAHWDTRKSLLINSVDGLFDFRGDEKKKESFAALLYYIHILGDHLDDKSYKVQNGLKIDVGGRTDKNDIIHELIHYLEILFRDQKHTHKYVALMWKLEKINAQLEKLQKSDGGINSDEKFAKKMKYSEELKEILSLYLPEMLKNSEFFHEVFY